VAGYPDTDDSLSVVQTVTKAIQINTPYSTGNWDINVFTLPELAYYNQNGTFPLTGSTFCGFPAYGFGVPDNRSLSLNPNNNDSYSFGLVNYVIQPSGVATLPVDYNWSLTAPSFGTITFDEYITDNMRMVGMAFEIVNTTSDLEAQGLATVWRLPQSRRPADFLVGAQPASGGGGYANIPTDVLRCPPRTQAEAQLVPNSKTWKAKEGAYVVATMSSSDNPYKSPAPSNEIFVPYSNSYSAVPFPGRFGDYSFFSTPDPSTLNSIMITRPAPSFGVPFNSSGCYLTGLSRQTTLTITVRCYFEVAPSIQDASLITLASPSACYDSAALELYSEATVDLPAGVKVAENASGDWWRDVLGVLTQVADSPITRELASFVPGLGGGIAGVSSLAKGYLKATEKKPKPQKQVSTKNFIPEGENVQFNNNSTQRVLELEKKMAQMMAPKPRKRKPKTLPAARRK